MHRMRVTSKSDLPWGRVLYYANGFERATLEHWLVLRGSPDAEV